MLLLWHKKQRKSYKNHAVLQHQTTIYMSIDHEKRIILQKMVTLRVIFEPLLIFTNYNCPMNTLVQRQLQSFTAKAQKYHHKTKSYLIFSKEMISNPREMGACCASSPYLAKAMAKEVSHHQDGVVIELGGGSGAITRALLEQGVAPEKLITVERSPTLAAHLRRQFPDICVIEGDASKLDQLLDADIGKINAIVSGLPLRSLPKPVVHGIKQQIDKLLDDDGIFIQFTYNLLFSSLSKEENLRQSRTKVIWRNLPPARVDTFAKS